MHAGGEGVVMTTGVGVRVRSVEFFNAHHELPVKLRRKFKHGRRSSGIGSSKHDVAETREWIEHVRDTSHCGRPSGGAEGLSGQTLLRVQRMG